MRSFLKPAVGVVCLVALACAGCSSGGDASDPASALPGRAKAAAASPNPGTTKSSATSYAPYVSATADAHPRDDVMGGRADRLVNDEETVHLR